MIVTQIVFWRHRKKARKDIITDWSKFLNAAEQNDVQLLNYLGDKLIWNRYISQSQIDRLNEEISIRLETNPILLDLYDVTKKRLSYLSDDDRVRIYGE